jgi:major vault protein
MSDKNSIRIPPYHYIHVLDANVNVTRIEVGPQTFIRQDHEKIVTGDRALKMVTIPPRHYCEITEPVIIDKEGNPVKDKHGQVMVRHGEWEIRFNEVCPDPFPLYPREELRLKPTKLVVVKENTALRMEATRNFLNKDGKEIVAGDEWIFIGPATYYPRVEEKIVSVVNAVIIGEQQALRLRARQDLVDRNGVKRKTGEEWLIRTPGSYLPNIYETVVELQNSYIITPAKALHLRASRTFTDTYKKERRAGEEWLVTSKDTSFHILDVFEEYVGMIPITILSKTDYCVVLDPFDEKTGMNRMGAKELKVGEVSFFLRPGESLDGGIKATYILAEDTALLLRAKEQYKDQDGEHLPGDKWMVYGPRDYIPPVEVEVVEVRKRIPLDKNEGIYVRDTRTGLVRSESNKAYMLAAHEELWEKELTETEEDILKQQIQQVGYKRDKTRVVTYRCPFNSAVQVYDYKQKKSRVIFGPELVMLGPDEQFTVSVLSGGKPKKPGVIQTLAIMMGPDFSTDIIEVETSDHTRLKMQLSYNWHFKMNKGETKTTDKPSAKSDDPVIIKADDEDEAQTIFNVRDFIGDMCNQLASKVRAAVASVSFDEFHKTSAKLIRKSIFGVDERGKVRSEYFFKLNNLVVTNVDIQTVEPVEKTTLENLQKAVTLAIEISTKSQEAQYRFEADRAEQSAKGELDKLQIEAKARAEEANKKLLELQAECKGIQNTGLAKAEAQAKANAEKIRSQTQVSIAEKKAEAKRIEAEADLNKKVSLQTAQLKHEEALANLEIERAKSLAEIESNKFEQMISAIGPQTIVAMSKAGPEYQVELLKGLGLQGFIMTDGNNPINLFNTANGLVGNAGQQ